MDRCLTEEPTLVAVGAAGAHRSACFLPGRAVGLAEETEQLRRSAVGEGRHAAAAEVADAIAASPEARGA
jgi:peptide/nickel transport system ATP-binding protein